MLEQMGIAAKQASYKLAQLSSREKNRVLEKIADELEAQSEIILNANAQDVADARANYLLAFNVRNVLQLRHRINQIFYANFTRCVVRFGCGVTTTGNGPAGC